MSRETKRDKILNELKRAYYVARATQIESKAWVHMSVLNSIAFRYGARIYDLRQLGIEIDKRACGEDAYEYRLITDPDMWDWDKSEPKVKPVKIQEDLFNGLI